MIELKIEDADGRDNTQLQSYMRDVQLTARVPDDKVEGLLIAPGFQEKVLNAAARDRHLHLLRFLRED